MSSVRMDTLARYTRFVRGLMTSPSNEVIVMCGVAREDIRTVTGSNLALIGIETGLNPVKASIGTVKEKLRMKISSVPDIDKWRIDYLARLLRERGEAFYSAEEEEVNRLTILIDSLCVN